MVKIQTQILIFNQNNLITKRLVINRQPDLMVGESRYILDLEAVTQMINSNIEWIGCYLD